MSAFIRTIIPRRWLILLAVMLAFLPVVIDMTILHIAVPSLTLALGASANEVLWIIDIYPLLMAGLLVPMGALADRVGNRRVLLTGLAVFGVASILAAFAPTPALLMGARVLLAIGGSMIMPCVLGIIRRTFEYENERAMALGLWGIRLHLAMAAEPQRCRLLRRRAWSFGAVCTEGGVHRCKIRDWPIVTPWRGRYRLRLCENVVLA